MKDKYIKKGQNNLIQFVPSIITTLESYYCGIDSCSLEHLFYLWFESYIHFLTILKQSQRSFSKRKRKLGGFCATS